MMIKFVKAVRWEIRQFTKRSNSCKNINTRLLYEKGDFDMKTRRSRNGSIAKLLTSPHTKLVMFILLLFKKQNFDSLLFPFPANPSPNAWLSNKNHT